MSDRLSVRRVIDATIDVVSNHFPAFFALALLGAAPSLVMALFPPVDPTAAGFAGVSPGRILLMWLAMGAAALVWLFASVALLYAVDDAAHSLPVDRRSALERARAAFPRALFASIIGFMIAICALTLAGIVAFFPMVLAMSSGDEVVALGIGLACIALIACIALPLVIAPLTLFVPAVVAFQRIGAVDSVQRGFALVKGRRLRAALITVIALAATWIPGMAWTMGTDLYTTTFDSGLLARLFFTGVTVLISACVTPLYAAAVVFSYRALVPRTESRAVEEVHA